MKIHENNSLVVRVSQTERARPPVAWTNGDVGLALTHRAPLDPHVCFELLFVDSDSEVCPYTGKVYNLWSPDSGEKSTVFFNRTLELFNEAFKWLNANCVPDDVEDGGWCFPAPLDKDVWLATHLIELDANDK